jgi:hypothetical protein
VHLLLTPSGRYLNSDTMATLTWRAAPAVSSSSTPPGPATEPGSTGGTAGGAPEPSAAPPIATTAGDPGGSATSGAVTAPVAEATRLRAAAAEASFLVAGGSALLGLAVLTLLLPRRRSADR